MGNRLLALVFTLIPASIFAQEKWDLRRCVDYAMKNNISVQQADVQARIAEMQVKQSKQNRWPTASFASNLGLQFGRSISPTTNLYTTQELLYNQYQLQGGAQIYNWGRLKHAQAAAEFNAEAALLDVEKAANDIALNVASYYLQVLASNEQVKIVEVQISQTKTQYDITKKRVDAGSLPELNLVELEAQLATDSSNLITAKATLEQNKLMLKALLNLDMAAPFDVDTPPVDRIPVDPIAEMQPDYVYQLALATQPEQKAFELRLKGAEKTLRSNKGVMYPSITGFYNLASTYNNQQQSVIGSETVNPPIGKVDIDGVTYPVYPNQPFTQSIFGKSKYFDQLSNNFSQALGIGLTIPIFNNGSYRNTYERSKLDLKNIELNQLKANQTLQSNVYNAYNNAVAALEKFNAGSKTVASSQKAYDYALKRYEVGLLPTLELITNQNTLLRAKLQQLANQYDYVFKMKVLEFYKGQGIKL